MFRNRFRSSFAIALAVLLLAMVSACSSDDSSDNNAASSTTESTESSDDSSPPSSDETPQSDVLLTVYTDQHLSLIETLTAAYTEETGVKFNIQPDANFGQIEAEGSASPADIFLSEDPGPVAQLAKADLLVELDSAIVDQVQPGLSDPNNLWVAYAARTRVLYYNPTVIDEADLPESLMDLTDEKYKGSFAWAPSGAFVATTQYLISTIGEEATTEFLEGIKANGVNEQKNGNVRDTVEAGKHAMGLSNHYYWWIKANEVGGPDQMTSKIYNFPIEDPGNLILSSGAGILASSKNQAAAADFLEWLTNIDGGQVFLSSDDLALSGGQYPVAVGSESALVGSLADVKSPVYDMSIFANQTEAQDLLKRLGMSS
ncbi:MAG: extracellular solute-binding protein [Acidimicrobiia bacterium]